MRRVLLLALVGLSACATPSGPDSAELTGLIKEARLGRSTHLRDVRCALIPEEGTEWSCRYRQLSSEGRWVPAQTVVAVDGDRWVLIDGLNEADLP